MVINNIKMNINNFISYFYIIYNFLIILFSNNIACQLTTAVAEKLSYYDFVDKLRIESEKFLSNLDECFKAKVMYLNNQHLNRKASVLSDIYRYKIRKYRNLFDDIFLNIDEYEVVNGNYLDEHDRDKTEKAALIDISKKELKNKLDHLISLLLKKYSKDCKLFHLNK